MLDEEQAVDVLAIRRNGLWTIKIFTPESQKAKEVFMTELIYQETCTQEMLYCPDCNKRYRPDDFFTDS